MNTEEQIEAVLQQYKSILESYRGVFSRTAIEAGHNEDAPEYGFDRKQMAKPDSNLFAMIGREFKGKPLEQAQQQIDFWRVMYIDVQETNNPFSFEGTPEHQQWKALGQTFLDNARAMAERWCNRGEATPRGAGYLPPDKGTAEKGTDTNLETLLQAHDNLNTGRAKEVFGKAIEKGLIVVFDYGLKKQGISKAQLAYMLQRIYIPDATGADGKQFPETALNGLFDESRLGEALRKLADNKNTNGKPRGYQVIDGLFNDK